jgi:hypothetical protein
VKDLGYFKNLGYAILWMIVFIISWVTINSNYDSLINALLLTINIFSLILVIMFLVFFALKK